MNVYKLNTNIILFSLIFGVVFYDLIQNKTGFSYIDEFISLFLVIYLCLCKKKQAGKELYFFIAIAFFYLIFSLLFPHNVTASIFTDFFIQIKPFFAFTAFGFCPLIFMKKTGKNCVRFVLVFHY